MLSLSAAPPVLAATPAVPPERVTPGIGGFLVFFLLGLASWLLYRSFAKHVRRVDVRSRLRAEEEAARRDHDETRGTGGTSRDDGPAEPPSGPSGPGRPGDGRPT